jgi:hypothetical protein
MITVEKEVYEAVLRNSLRATQSQIKKELLEAKLHIAIKGLEKIKHIGEVKKLGAVYQVAERTLAKIEELKK